MKIQLADIHGQHAAIADELREAVSNVFDRCQFILGENVCNIEKELAAECGSKFAVAVNSGTDALMLALAAVGVGAGDEVITTPFTFVATAEVMCLLGAKPVFADIDPNTFLMDLDDVVRKIGPKTKAIMPVHLFGQLAQLELLDEICKAHNLKLIGDGAQAIGALRHGKPLASIGDAATLSFYPTKNLGGCGDGGMVLTNDPDINAELLLLRFHGSGGGYHYKRIGYCSRLDEIQAAVLRVKAKYLHEWNSARRVNADLYMSHLAGLNDHIALPKALPDNYHVYHQFTIRVLEGTNKRQALQQFLRDREIGSAVFYPLSLHLQEAYEFLGYKPGDFPNSEMVTEQVLSLPVHPGLTPAQILTVSRAVTDFFA